MTARGLALLAVLAAPLATACSPAVAPGAPPIATVHRAQCGRCHSPPEPGSQPRDALGDAFGRHHKRVRLSDEQWQAMIDYLAAPAN